MAMTRLSDPTPRMTLPRALLSEALRLARSPLTAVHLVCGLAAGLACGEYFSVGSVRPGLTFRPVIFLRLHNGRPLSNLNPARGDAPETGRVARLALPFHADLPANSPSPRRAPAS